MAGKHRGCNWLHKWRVTEFVKVLGDGSAHVKKRCERCGRRDNWGRL